MRLASVRIENFRCFEQPAMIEIDELTAIIGQNDAGKSSILDALNVFFNFRDAKLEPTDRSVNGDPQQMTITCEFDQLPSTIVIDSTHSTTLEAEYLLNAKNRLEITKVYKTDIQKPRESVTYLTAAHPTVAGARDLLNLKNQDLKKRADELGVLDLVENQSINADLRSAIRDSFDDLEISSAEITVADLEKGDGKEIWQQLERRLPAYFLFRVDRPSTDQDSEAQDPLKAAVKSALDKVETELQAIATRVREETSEITAETLDKLRELDDSLANQLNPRFAEPTWHSAFKISVEDNDGIPINKRGSGVRRLILLSFLQAQAERSPNTDGRNLIYAVEEPETSQHPNTQRQLYHALAELSQRSDTQLLITTHNPALGKLLPETSVRYVEIASNGGRVVHGPNEETYGLVAEALGVLSSHSVELFIGVEGGNDISFLKRMSVVLREGGLAVPDLEALENSHKIVFIPFAGSNLGLWVTRLKALDCPEIHIVDRDTAPPAPPAYAKEMAEIEERDNCSAFATSVREMENYLHSDAIEEALGIRVEVEDFADVPELVAEQLHIKNKGLSPWSDLPMNKREKKVSKAKKRLNTEAAAKMTVARLEERDCHGDIRRWLQKIESIVGNGD